MQTFSPKHPQARLNIGFDFSNGLSVGETVTSCDLTVSVLRGTDGAPQTILNGVHAIVGNVVSQFVDGGVDGVTYLLTAKATTSGNQVLIDEGVLQVISSQDKSAFFIKAIDVPGLRSNYLSLSSFSVLNKLSDDAIWANLQAAEADLSRRLTIALAPVEIFPQQPTQGEIDALSGTPYLVEPGYDLPPDFFSSGKFGGFLLREKPVIAIDEIKLIYPNQGGASFTIPNEWIRVDHKYGHVHLFPSAQMVSAPLSIMTMQAMGAGFTVPHMIRVRYRAGLSENHELYPDIVNLVKRMAVLSMLHSSFLPQSGSISSDGLSQTNSFDMSKFQGDIESQIETLKQSLIGPVFGVL